MRRPARRARDPGHLRAATRTLHCAAPPRLLDPPPVSTRVYMHTLGCPKNRVDSEVMLGSLVSAGFRFEPDPAKAEIIVVNTCGFIGDAKEESIDAIVALAGQKASGRC